jgi:hypothetical protein
VDTLYNKHTLYKKWISSDNLTQREQAVALLVEALRYKPERRGSIPDEVIGFFFN